MRFVKAWMVAGLALCAAQAAGAAERRTWLVGGGEVSGYYYPQAGALCRVINKEKPQETGCAVVPSSGSAANLAALRAGEVDFALVQSRAAFAAATGTEGFAEAGPFADLRAVLALPGESVVLLARPGSGIEEIAHLKGKRVNVGRPGSFQRMMADVTLEAVGLSEGDLAPAVEMDLGEQGGELCEGNLDAAFFAGIHPMPEVAETIDRCDAVMVSIKGKSLESYLKANAWLSRALIRKETYDAQKDEMTTLQVRTLLVTTTRQGAESVAGWIRAVQANFGPFIHLHPVLNHVGKGDLGREPWPLRRHDGAEKVFSEK